MIQNGKPLFYGWWIAAAAAIGMGLGGPPILVFCFPVFLKALTHDFHASRSAISLAFTLHNVASAFAAPFVGRLLDRIGVRKFIVVGTLLLALLLIGNSLITVSVAGIYAFNILGGIFRPELWPDPLFQSSFKLVRSIPRYSACSGDGRPRIVGDGDAVDRATHYCSDELESGGGEERTIPEYRSLLSASGFQLTKITSTSTGFNVIEALPM